MTDRRRIVERWRVTLLLLAGASGLLGFLLENGTELSAAAQLRVSVLIGAAVALFLLELLLAAFTIRPWRLLFRRRWPALLLALLLSGELAAVHWGGGTWLAPFFSFFSIRSVTQAYIIAIQFYILGNLLVHVPAAHGWLAKRRVRPGAAFLLAFLVLILCGTALLLLPKAAAPGQPIGVLDALFTSTSAVCVTGLIVRDTATAWTPFGQAIILLLIQLGGLGIMSLTATLAWLLGRGIGIREGSFLREVFQVPDLGDVARVLRFIVLFTFLAEIAGAVLLYLGFGDLAENPRLRLFTAVFHAVSAFCNAGFSTFSDSLVSYQDDPLVMGTISGLLVCGGLGFTVVANLLAYLQGRLRRQRPDPHNRLSVQTRVVIWLSAILLFGGAALLLLVEGRGAWSGQPFSDQLHLALFQSVTTRTAGFNSCDLSVLSQPSLYLMIVLMFIGAAPGSTAGGVKVTTLAIMWANLQAIAKGRRQTRLLDREISLVAVRRATVVLFGGLAFGAVGLFLLLLTEESGFLETAFEVVSAQGTVGLSLGLTPALSPAGRLIVVMMMYLGRLGPLTFAYGLVSPAREHDVRLPRAKIMVG